jgi:hypothetical protein
LPADRQVVASAEPVEVFGEEILDSLQGFLVGGFGAQRHRVRAGLRGALAPAEVDGSVSVGPFDLGLPLSAHVLLTAVVSARPMA